MILRSLSLRDVRRFGTDGIRLELQSGLNVLSEANEFGKSTVFEAVRTALFFKHGSQDKTVRSLEPWTGGIPHIEIEMELPANSDLGGPVKLTRRFHRSSGLTELRDGAGREIARADDAHQRLLGRLGADRPGTGPTGLLWVEQGNSIPQPETGPANTALLSDVLSQEVGALTGGERSRAYLDAARERLKALRTVKTRKSTGELRDAESQVEQLEEELTEARRRAAETEAARTELTRVSGELDRMAASAPDSAGTKLEAARAALKEAERADDRLQLARREHEIAEREHKEAQGKLAARHEAEERRKALEATVASLEASTKDTRASLEALAASRADLQVSERDARTAADAARLAVKGAQASQAARDARDELEHAREALVSAQEAVEDLEKLDADDSSDLDRKTMDHLEDLENARRDAAARLSGVVTVVEAEGASITLDGAPLPAGAPTQLLGDAVIEVGGERLHIRPPTPGQARRDLDTAEGELAHALEALGLPSLTQARELADAQAETRRRRESLRERLKAYAPSGLDALQARVAKLEEVSTHDDEVAEPHLLADASERADAALAEMGGQLRAAQAAETKALTQVEVIGERLSRARQDLEAAAGQLTGDASVLETRLDDTQIKSERLGAKVAALLSDMPNLDGAKAEVARLRNAARNRVERVSALREQRGELRQKLEAARAEAIGERVDVLTGQLERETRRRDALMLKADALTRLVEVLEGAQAELQDRFNAPILRALQPLLSEVIPEAQITLGSEFRAEGLHRNGISEPVLQLSGGTQGQISALTRLAFADILQGDGRPVPVIFDETFVHSDDQRLEGMFRALNMACARGVQCIVMTCHQGLFEGLGGHRIVPRPWN